MLAKAERPLILAGGALLADSLHDKAVYADLRRLAEELGAADQPHPPPAATVRRAVIRTTAATWASGCRRR